MNSAVLLEFKSKKIFGGLDGLRCLSIIAVVWHHSVGGVDWLRASSYGFLGVDLFFVISGFLIVSLLLREKDNTGNISLKGFYVRRALRIFPLYYGFILGLVFMYFILNRRSETYALLLKDLPIYLLYLGNFVPVTLRFVWSLASEEQFYMVWPFLEKHFGRAILFILFSLIVVNQIINFYGYEIFEAMGVSYLSELSVMQATFTPILLGVGLAHMLHKGILLQWLLPLLRYKYSSFIWFVLLFAVLELAPRDISGAPRLVVQCLMVLLVGSTVLTENHYLNRLLMFKPFVRIGAISYGIYLLHIYCIVVAHKILQKLDADNSVLVFLLATVIVIVVAELSFRFYEMPFLKLKEKFSVIHQKHI